MPDVEEPRVFGPSSYRAIAANLRTMPREELVGLTRADYERKYGVSLTDNGRIYLSKARFDILNPAEGSVKRKAPREQKSRFTSNLILYTFDVNELDEKTTAALVMELPGVVEGVLRAVFVPNPPALKIVQTIEDGVKKMEIRVK